MAYILVFGALGTVAPGAAAQAKASPERTIAGKVVTKAQVRAPGGRQQLYTPKVAGRWPSSLPITDTKHHRTR